MDLKSIIDMDLQPLNKDEIKEIEMSYNQDFSKMSSKNAITLLKMVISVNSDSLDVKLLNLLIRRLNMIVDFSGNPELLI
jgi:hypothetical protein